MFDILPLDSLPKGLLWATVIFWGAIWGSFANVVIARVPYAKSVAFPASHCPRCETPIRWFDNLPVVSWFLLKGRCRACETPISVRYPMVELIGILCSVAAAWIAIGGYEAWRLSEAPALEVAIVWMLLSFFFLILLMLTLIDLEHLLLPHRLTITLAVVAFIFALLVPPGGEWRGMVPSPSLLSASVGFVVAYGGLFVFAMGYQLLTGRQGIGGGDFMLFGALGAWFGWEALPMLMLLAAFQGVLGFVIAQRFFPSLIRVAGGDDFWAATTGESAESTNSMAGDEDTKREPVSGDVLSAQPTAFSEAADADERDELLEGGLPAGGRGVPFGPFLCLAAVEFVFVGPLYIQWLNGGL